MAAATSDYKIFGLGLLGQVFAAMGIAIVFALLLRFGGITPDKLHFLEGLCTFFSTIFLAAIKMVVPTLIFFALLSGVLSMGGGLEAGRVAVKSICAFLGTALFAVIIGLTCGIIFQPGKGLEGLLQAAQGTAAVPTSDIKSLGDFFGSLKPINPIMAMANEKYIQIIYFVFFMGYVINSMRKDADSGMSHAQHDIAMLEALQYSADKAMAYVDAQRQENNADPRLASIGDGERALAYVREKLARAKEDLTYAQASGSRVERLKQGITDITPIMFKMIEYVVRLAPLAVFGTITQVVWTEGLGTLLDLKGIVLTTLFACFLQYLIFGILIAFVGKLDPRAFFKKVLPIQGLAFSTSSSKATLRFAMQHMQESMGVSPRGANFILPLGASINMDGTAIYLAIATLFFAQAMHIDLTLTHYLTLVVVATVGSIGAAGIPSGSLVFIGIVASSVGITLTPAHIGVILTIDRLLDMVRTTLNITGDCALTLMLESNEKTLDERTYYNPNL